MSRRQRDHAGHHCSSWWPCKRLSPVQAQSARLLPARSVTCRSVTGPCSPAAGQPRPRPLGGAEVRGLRVTLQVQIPRAAKLGHACALSLSRPRPRRHAPLRPAAPGARAEGCRSRSRGSGLGALWGPWGSKECAAEPEALAAAQGRRRGAVAGRSRSRCRSHRDADMAEAWFHVSGALAAAQGQWYTDPGALGC